MKDRISTTIEKEIKLNSEVPNGIEIVGKLDGSDNLISFVIFFKDKFGTWSHAGLKGGDIDYLIARLVLFDKEVRNLK